MIGMVQLAVFSLFSNGMVLQRDATVPVWGKATPGANVTVLFCGKTYRAQADNCSKWRILLDSQAAGGPHLMEISSPENAANERICIEDIYFGDVWICSGQSNMEMPMQRVKDDFLEEWDPPINPLIRQFTVPQEWDFSGARDSICGSWMSASAETLNGFSATAWFFARALFEKHRIPVGIINSSWGGTPIESWMSREALAPFPDKIARSSQYADAAFRETISRSNESAIKAWDTQLAADSGITHNWHQPEQWANADGTLPLPGDFASSGIADFCGSIWLHREIEADGIFAANESRLWLGAIVDADTVYVNGVEVGNTGYRYPPRKYIVPAGLLRKGSNHIAIRVICNNGQGGIVRDKELRIFSEYGAIELNGLWEYRVGIRINHPRPEDFFFQWLPMCLFNAMIAPILQYPCKGILWYQGESNCDNPGEYSALLPALINDWRNKASCTIPFFIVQLPIFGEPDENNESSSWAILREAQCSALSLSLTGMAAGLDLGEWNDIHPINKKGIGSRLALAAEKLLFNENNSTPGPKLREMRKEQNRLLLFFDNCGTGLITHEKPYLSVIGDGKIVRLPACIAGTDCLSVDISDMTNAEKILYAWADNPRDRQLFNSDSLPMIPFKAKVY